MEATGKVFIKPERIVLKIGTLEVNLTADFRGTVTVDGKELLVRGLEISGGVGRGVRVMLDIVPVKKG